VVVKDIAKLFTYWRRVIRLYVKVKGKVTLWKNNVNIISNPETGLRGLEGSGRLRLPDF
jgi:hypothetical protein